MQLVSAGRNEPCPCGSSRKYKKCCLLTRDLEAAGAGAGLDVAALVDRALDTDDWEPIHEVFDQGFVLFEPMAPLEHIRFGQDQIDALVADRITLSRLCTAGWQRRCGQEIDYVLGRFDLEPSERDGLRMASHLLRRFGARSPLVEQVAELQTAERRVRVQKLGHTISRYGLTTDDVLGGWKDCFAWIERAKPPVPPFADWVALRSLPAPEVEQLWQSCVAGRVSDVLLVIMERPELPDAREWLQLAALAVLSPVPGFALALCEVTSPRLGNADEQRIHDAIVAGTACSDESLRGDMSRVLKALEARNDHAGAAMLRDAARRVQSSRS